MCRGCRACGGQDEAPLQVSHSWLLGPTLDELLLHAVCLLAETSGFLQHHCQGEQAPPSEGRFDLGAWLSCEINALASEIACCKMDTREPGDCSPTESRLSARRFVLERLAELMAKKEELEYADKIV